MGALHLPVTGPPPGGLLVLGSNVDFLNDIPLGNGRPIAPLRRGRAGPAGVPCRTDIEPAGGRHRKATSFPRIPWVSEQPQGLGLQSRGSSIAEFLPEIPQDSEGNAASCRNPIERRAVIAHQLLTIDDRRVYQESGRDFKRLHQLLSYVASDSC